MLTDWRYRTIGLHDFTTHKVISPAFGPTGDHRMEGILLASGSAFRTGATLREAELLDIAPTVLHLLGIPVPGDMDGRVLAEILDPSLSPVDLPVSAAALAPAPAHAHATSSTSGDSVYTAEEDAEIQRRLEELGYL